MKFFVRPKNKKLISVDDFMSHLEVCLRTSRRGTPYRLVKLRLELVEELIEYFGTEDADMLVNLLLFWQYPFKHEDLGQEVLELLKKQNGTCGYETDSPDI